MALSNKTVSTLVDEICASLQAVDEAERVRTVAGVLGQLLNSSVSKEGRDSRKVTLLNLVRERVTANLPEGTNVRSDEGADALEKGVQQVLVAAFRDLTGE